MTSTPLVEENNISQELEVPDIQDMKTIRIHFNSALNSTRKGLPISANYALVHVSKSISLHQCGFRIINHRLHKDVMRSDNILHLPIYMAMFL